MAVSNHEVERMGIGLVLCVALLTFLSPLVSLRGPEADQLGDAYHLRAGLTFLQSSLRVFDDPQLAQNGEPSTGVVAANVARVQSPAMPYSLRIAPLSSWLIFAALAFAALALLDVFSVRKAFAALSLAGGCCAALAVVHLMRMSSDLQSWAVDLLSSGSLGSPNNPVLGTRVLLLNSFQVGAGPGLYTLASCLFLVPVLSYTSAIPRARSVMRGNPRVKVSQPVRVRPVNSRYAEETCTSIDLSRSGLLVQGVSDHYFVGMEVYVTRNAQPNNSASPEEHGSVVRVEKPHGGKCRLAIKIISAA